MNDIENLQEKDYKEFFEWILDKTVTMDKEIDFTLCSTQNNPYIYFPNEIKQFLQTKPMQRLRKVTQLGSGIIEDSNAYHTRYSHCLGTYNNVTIFYMQQFKNPNWRKRIEQENRKIEVLADIMESLRHDDGHNILSHCLEKLIGKEYGAHEILGARFKSEYPETQEALTKIHPDLLANMQKVSDPNYPLITLREGNVDFDRLDFMARDMFHLGELDERKLVDRLITNSSIQTIINDGKKQEGVVYEYEALQDIEKFLSARARNYQIFYSSNTRKAYDILEEQFCRRFVKSDEVVGKDLKNYLQNCIEHGGKGIDLNEFLEWNDMRYFNELFDISLNAKDPNLRKLALDCLPSTKSLCCLALEMIDPKATKPENLTETEKNFLKNIKSTMKPEHPLHEALTDKSIEEKIISVSSKEKLDELITKLNQANIDTQNETGMYTWQNKIKVYNPKEPIFVRGINGDLYTFDKHPDKKLDISPRYNYGAMISPALMRINGIDENKIEQAKSIFDNYDALYSGEKLRDNNRARKFKVGNSPYIPEYQSTPPRKYTTFEDIEY